MSKFKVGDVVRLNAEFQELSTEPSPQFGDEITITRIDRNLCHFMMYGVSWVALETQADLVTDPETIGLVKYGEDYCAAYGDGFKDGGKAQADDVAAYREFYEFVASIDGIAELAEGLKADDDLEGWAEFSALVDRIREMRGEG